MLVAILVASLIDWISDTQSQGCTDVQSLTIYMPESCRYCGTVCSHAELFDGRSGGISNIYYRILSAHGMLIVTLRQIASCICAVALGPVNEHQRWLTQPCLTAYCIGCNTPVIQALYQALNVSVSGGQCI